MASVCLISKVKNEQKVVKRMLDSVKEALGEQLEYWIIHDTGSTDDTIKIIKETMEGIPGEVKKVEWENFGDNNTKLFEDALGKTDYAILVDADFVLEGALDLEGRSEDAFNVQIYDDKLSWYLPLITNNRMKFHYVGACHEYLACVEPFVTGIVRGLVFRHLEGGFSSNSAERNLELLLGQDEYSVRDMFYIGQTYQQLGQNNEAIEWYEKHIAQGDLAEEVFMSKVRVGLMRQSINELLAAWDYRPWRAEPLYEAILILRNNGQWHTAVMLAEVALQIPYPENDNLFVNQNVYEYDLLYQYSICLDYVDRPAAIKVFYQLLGMPDIPDYVREWTEKNLANAIA